MRDRAFQDRDGAPAALSFDGGERGYIPKNSDPDKLATKQFTIGYRVAIATRIPKCTEPGACVPEWVSTTSRKTSGIRKGTRHDRGASTAPAHPGRRAPRALGLRDASGQLRASRVEALAAGVGADELRGVVSNPDPGNDRFTLNGNVTVNYAGATLIPAGTIFSAVTVELENLSDSDMIGREGEQHEIEAKGTMVSGTLVAEEVELED